MMRGQPNTIFHIGFLKRTQFHRKCHSREIVNYVCRYLMKIMTDPN